MIGFLYPEICNQQGDQGYFDWLNAHDISACSIEDKEVTGLRAVLVGDVSERGAEILRAKLENHWILEAIKEGLTVLAIGRAGLEIAKALGVSPPMNSYKSEFVETEFQGRKLYGYINGLYDTERLVTETQVGQGRLILCALLGPVAVVNPWFENYCFGIETSARDDLTEHYKNLVAD